MREQVARRDGRVARAREELAAALDALQDRLAPVELGQDARGEGLVEADEAAVDALQQGDAGD